MKRFWSKVERRAPGECWPWKAAKTRYGWFRLDGRMQRAHRVAWHLVHGAIPSGSCVLHRCDNPSCVNPAHLWLGTQLENIGDMVTKGRARSGGYRHPVGALCGERNPRAKLTPAKVRRLRSLRRRGLLQDAIADRLGVSQATVNNVLLGKSWAHVE